MDKKLDIVYFAKVKPNGIIPAKRSEDAGYDAYACFDGDYFVILPLQSKLVPLGISGAFDKKYYIQIEERSSTGKLGIKKNSGVIDSGYRGEYGVIIFNSNSVPLIISKVDSPPKTIDVDGNTFETKNAIIYPAKKAICELVFHIVPELEVEEVSYDELLGFKSERGTGGFGSSGK